MIGMHHLLISELLTDVDGCCFEQMRLDEPGNDGCMPDIGEAARQMGLLSCGHHLRHSVINLVPGWFLLFLGHNIHSGGSSHGDRIHG